MPGVAEVLAAPDLVAASARAAAVRLLYVVGAPGVGKSTMVRWLLEPFTRLPAVKSKSLPLVRWEPLARNGQLVGGHLGYTRGAFSGTDALGMAVNPQACRWMLESKTAGQLDFIVGEGARLANSAFFTAARARADRVLLVQLRAREETLDARCEVRGSKQNESWRRGARTRADNALAAAVALGLEAVILDADSRTPQSLAAEVATLFDL